MRAKLLACLALTLAALFGFRSDSNAQVTGVSIDSSGVFSWSYCSIPDTAWVDFSGHATGTFSSSDIVTLYINFGDGTDTTTTLNLFANQGWFWFSQQHVYTAPGTYTVMMAATTSAGPADTAYANTVTYTTNCANLSGDLYVDADNDCVKDAGEDPLVWRMVEITSGASTYYTWSNAAGHYAVDLPAGFTYTVTPDVSWSNLTATCPSSGSSTVALSAAAVENFAYSCNTSAIDYAVGGWANNWRPGFTRPLYIHVTGNNWCGSISPVTLTATLPSALHYSSTSYGPAPTVTGSTLNWTISSPIDASNSFYATVMIYCDTPATIGDTLCVGLAIGVTDANAANNNSTVCAEINNSFDPNDKGVSPQGLGAAGNIPNGTRLTYRINFQNTGNDVAYDVVVKDEIDTDLDMSTMEIVGSSHPMSVTAVGRTVSFRFDNINLPDSGANEPASHGFIVYAIQPKANLPLGTQLNNTANIYFDFNDPIVTNTTLNTIAAPQSVHQIANGNLKASIFPNPANSSINIELNEKEGFKAEMYDMMGRMVSAANGANGKAAISVSSVPSGMYLIRISNNANQVLSTQINVLH